MPGMSSKNSGFYPDGYGGQQQGRDMHRLVLWKMAVVVMQNRIQGKQQKRKKGEREAVAQWQSPCLEGSRAWIQSLVMPKKC